MALYSNGLLGKKLSIPVVNILVGWGEAKIALRLHKTTMEKAFQPESLYDICNGVYPLIFQLVFAFTLTFISVPYFRSSLFMFRRMFCFALSFDFSINFCIH